MAARVCVVVALAACTPIPPPPMVPLHADPGASGEDGATRVLVVVGGALQVPWLDGGLGVAVRAEVEPAFGDETLGLELSGGTGREDRTERGAGWRIKSVQGPRRWLFAARGYGRHALDSGNAVTYGAGGSWFSTGLVTLTADLGFAHGAHYRNGVDTAYVAPGLAVAIPIRPGVPFGDHEARTPKADVYPYLSLGMLAANSSAAASLDLTLGYGIRSYRGLGALSLGGSLRVE